MSIDTQTRDLLAAGATSDEITDWRTSETLEAVHELLTSGVPLEHIRRAGVHGDFGYAWLSLSQAHNTDLDYLLMLLDAYSGDHTSVRSGLLLAINGFTHDEVAWLISSGRSIGGLNSRHNLDLTPSHPSQRKLLLALLAAGSTSEDAVTIARLVEPHVAETMATLVADGTPSDQASVTAHALEKNPRTVRVPVSETADPSEPAVIRT